MKNLNSLFLCAVAGILAVSASLSPLAAQADVVAQAEQAFEAADGELRDVFGQLVKKISHSKTRANFEESQRAWVAFRAKEASARAGLSSEGGSAFAIDYLAEMAALSKERTSQLRAVTGRIP